MLITWLDFGRILLDTLFLPNFHLKFGMCFFSKSNTIGHIAGMFVPIDVNRKGGASVGYLVNYVTLTLDLTHDIDLWFFKVKFQNSCISGNVIWLVWNKKNNKSIRYWADCLVLPFNHIHSLDLGGGGGGGGGWGGVLVDMEQRGCESIIHDRDLWVTMMEWVDVPYSDWGVFRRRRAFHISGLIL